MTLQEPVVEGRARSILPLVPIGIAAVFIIVANLIFICFRVFLPYPATPWDAGIVTDAWRMLHGEAVYAVGTDHATLMHGPLVTVFLAQLFRFTGPALYPGQLASAISGIAVVILLVRIFGRGERLVFGVGVALLLAANSRTQYYFTQTRPDLDSMLFATLALMVLYRGIEPAIPRIPLVLAGTVLLVIAVLFKQPAAVFMFIPGLSMAGSFRTSSLRKKIACAIPVAGVLITWGAIRQFVPGLWHFMVEVPAQYHVDALRVGRIFVEFIASIPLFVLAFVHWLDTDARDTWRLPRVRWLLAALVCTVPVSIVALAKEGGVVNSLIPAILSTGAFCVWRTPVLLGWLRDTGRPLSWRIVTGIVLGAGMFYQAYLLPGALSPDALKGGQGSNERALVIAEARSLPGKIVCPDDPTIPLMAKGYAGRTAAFEYDAVAYDDRRLPGVVKELNSADYVIAMQSGSQVIGLILKWEETQHMLTRAGFTRSAFRTTSSPVYELWKRTRPPH